MESVQAIHHAFVSHVPNRVERRVLNDAKTALADAFRNFRHQVFQARRRRERGLHDLAV
jgi:hypothetical protein